MSDSEDSCTGAEGWEVAPETQDDAPPVETTPGGPSPSSTSDITTDVAPTRRARRRPEPQPAAQVQETPKEEEKPVLNVENIVSDLKRTRDQCHLMSAEFYPTRLNTNAPSDSTVAQGGWGYWGSWGKSILSTATATVANVGQGLTQVIEKAETSLGIPSPTELSAQVDEEQKQGSPPVGETDSSAVGSAMGMFSSLSSVVQNTGKTVIVGGLDALEFIGKKTMDVIAEGDPGFKRTKGLMIRNATLSQVLREAKEREELQTADKEPSDPDKKVIAHYGMLFDEFQGLSHLEALEILSRESESKVKSVLTTLSGEELLELGEELDHIKESFSLVEFDEEDVDEQEDEDGSEFEKQLMEALQGLSVSATAAKLSKACQCACSHIIDMNTTQEEKSEEDKQRLQSVEAVHAAAIRSLAELTARSIELFHKLSETLLFSNGSAEAGVLSRVTVILCKEISLLSKKFTSSLTASGSNEKADVLNPLITGVFLEASNSASYIQDAFQLLLPILEICHIQRRAETTEH